MAGLDDFVSTSVLTSEDGLKFNEQEGVLAGGQRATVSRDLSKLEGRTLYEQLKSNKDKVSPLRDWPIGGCFCHCKCTFFWLEWKWRHVACALTVNLCATG